MFDPISIGLALLLSTAKDALQSKAAEAIFSGIIGNRADHLFISGYRKIKDILNLRNSEYPENHDLLRTLRMSMLKATEMLYQSMKDDEEEKKFRNDLKEWINKQVKYLPTLSKWADWENPAASEFELFFTSNESDANKKALMVEKMVSSWEKYIQSELQVNLPQAFTAKLKNGWIEDEKRIYWHEATMVLMIEALRNPKDEQSIRAAKAFEHNFLSDIKLQLSNIHELLLTQFANHETITKLSDTIASQQRTIETQAEENKIHAAENKTQAETINLMLKKQYELEEKLKQSETEKAQLQVENKTNKEIIERTEKDRKELNDFYKLYPATYQSKLDAIEEIKSLEEQSKEADEKFELRKSMEQEEVMRNALLKMKLAKQYEASYNFSEAIKACRAAIKVWDYPPFTMELASLLLTIGKYGEALKTLQRVLVSEDLEPHELEYSLKGWNLSGSIYMELMSYENAVTSFLNALLIHETIFGKVVDKGGEMLFNNVGCAYLKLGELEKSRFYLDKALEATNIIYGKGSIRAAACLNNIGDILNLQANFLEAKKYFDEAHSIFVEKGIKTHIELPTLLDNLSSVNRHLSKNEEAIKHAQESLRIRSEIYGGKGFQTAKSYMVLGHALKASGELNEALKIFKIASEIYFGDPVDGKLLLTDESANGIIDSQLTIAHLLMDENYWEDAFEWLSYPMNLIAIKFGRDSVPLANIIVDRALCLFKANLNDKSKMTEAKELWQSAIDIFKRDKRFEKKVAVLEDNILYADELLKE